MPINNISKPNAFLLSIIFLMSFGVHARADESVVDGYLGKCVNMIQADRSSVITKYLTIYNSSEGAESSFTNKNFSSFAGASRVLKVDSNHSDSFFKQVIEPNLKKPGHNICNLAKELEGKEKVSISLSKKGIIESITRANGSVTYSNAGALFSSDAMMLTFSLSEQRYRLEKALLASQSNESKFICQLVSGKGSSQRLLDAAAVSEKVSENRRSLIDFRQTGLAPVDFGLSNGDLFVRKWAQNIDRTTHEAMRDAALSAKSMSIAELKQGKKLEADYGEYSVICNANHAAKKQAIPSIPPTDDSSKSVAGANDAK